VLLVQLPIHLVAIAVDGKASLVRTIRNAAAMPVELVVRDPLGRRDELMEPADDGRREGCIARRGARVVGRT
jgi:hypothetical protein